jgi:hypothetical protein
MQKKILAIVMTMTLVVMMVPQGAFALTAEELQAQITALTAQLAALQAQLSSSVPVVGSFDTTLYYGMRSDKVKALQEFLISKGYLGAGYNTGYFGNLTKTAVMAYQTAKGITPVAGYFGPLTRAAANIDAGVSPSPSPSGSASPTPSPSAVGYQVELASNNPAAGTLADGSAYNVMLKAKVSAGVAEKSITSVTIERTGLSVDTNVSGVLVTVDEQGAKRFGNVVTLADNKVTITFASDPIKIAASQTATLSVQFHISALAQSGTIGAKITGMSGDPTGLPVTGNTFVITDGANNLGGLTIGVVSLTAALVNVDIGTTDYYLSKLRLTAGANEDISVSKMVFFQNGIVADDDLQNWELVDPNGVILASAAKAVGKIITFNLATPYVITKGTLKDLTIRVDVISGSLRTAQVIIQNDYDVEVKGVSTGAGILATAVAIGGSLDNTFPVGDIVPGLPGYNTLQVAAGTLTATKASTSPSGTMGIGASGVTVATWDLEAKGEDIQIQRADFRSTGTAVLLDLSGSIKLMTDAGQTLYTATPANLLGFFDGDIAGTDQVTFSTFYTIPAGQVLKLKLVVDTATGMLAGTTLIGNLSDVYYKRMTSNTYGTAAAATWQPGNTLTASAASLTVTNNASYGATAVIAGQSNVLVGSYLLQTGSAEGVNVSSLNVDLTRSGNVLTAGELLAISNMKLKRADTGVQIGSTVSTPIATNTVTVSGQLNIPANTTIEVDIYLNVATAGFATTYQTDLDAADVSGTGSVSGSVANAPAVATVGRVVAVLGAGTLAVSIETSGAAASQFYSAGLSGVEIARIKLAATVEDMKIQALTLRTVLGSGNIASVKLLGTGLTSDPSVPLTAGEAIFSFSSGSEIVVPAYSSRVLTAVVNTSSVGTIVAGDLGVLGFGTANAIGSGSGVTVQEQLTGTLCTATVGDATPCAADTTFAAGDLVYFTVNAIDSTDAGAAANTAPRFYVVTAVTAQDMTTVTGSLFLNGDPLDDVYFTTNALVTKLTPTSTEVDNDGNSDTVLAVGDVVYFYGDVAGANNSASTGWHVITTASGLNSANINLDGGAVAIDTGDIIVRFANASLSPALVGSVMRYEEVEPVMALATGSPSGSQSPNSEQSVGVFNLTATGYRDMSFRSLTVEKSGSNSPYRYVSKLSLWNGATKLAEVASTSKAGVADTALTTAVIGGTTGLEFCTTDDGGGAVTDEVSGISNAEWASLRLGDKVVFSDGTDEITATVATKGAWTSPTTCDGIVDSADNITFSNISQTTGAGAVGVAVNLYNYMVHFDANQADTGDTALVAQTVTAGQAMALTVKADTSNVRTLVISGTVTFGVSIPGVAGPLNTPTVLDEGLEWNYAALGAGATGYKSQADGYPVSGNTMTY